MSPRDGEGGGVVRRTLEMSDGIAELLRATALAAGMSESELLKRGIVAMRFVLDGHRRGLVPGAAGDPSRLDEVFQGLVPG